MTPRMRTASWLALGLGFALVFAPLAAHAQTPPDSSQTQPPPQQQPPPPPPPPPQAPADPNLEAAKLHFEQGVSLFNDGNYPAALAEFEQSYKLNPTPAVLYNIGLTQKALFHYTEAVDAITQYLSHRADLPPDRIAEAQKQLDELTALLADITLAITPADAAKTATVTVDGRTLPPEMLAHPIKLASGTHKIAIAVDGYKSADREIMVAAGVANTVSFAMVAIPKTGRVHIAASSDHATVKVDGTVRGIAPLDVDLGGGGHQIEVTAPGYQLRQEEVVVAAGTERTVSFTLDKTVQPRAWYSRPSFLVPVALVLVGGGVGVFFLEQKPSPIQGTLAPGVGSIR